MFKHLLRLPLYGLAVIALVCVLVIFFGIGDTPAVALGWRLNAADIIRAKQILHEGSKTRPEEIGTIELSRQDLNLAANYLLNRYSKSAVEISLKKNQLKFTATATLPENRIGKYLNITLALGNVAGNPLPRLTKFKAGKLLLPSYAAAAVLDYFIRHSVLNNYFLLATKPIKAVTIEPDKITITYFSDLDIFVKARNLLAGSNEAILSVYRQQIVETVSQHDPNWRLSLAELLKPVFALAYQRSTTANAIEENRMAIIAVNDYVNKDAKKILTLPATQSRAQYYSVFLYKRGDLAQHFIGSAAIAASVSGQVSTAMGEEKELRDAERVSGFSFIDLAADKAGTHFGEIATSSAEQARKLQKNMMAIKNYSDFMPDPTDLPEHMNEVEFKDRFGSTSSLPYQQLLQQIDDRIAITPIYQQE